MQTISGTYCTTRQKNITNGITVFTIKSEDRSLPLSEYGTILCMGEIRDYPKGTPLTLHGEFDSQSTFRVSSCEEGSGNSADILSFLSGELFPGVGPKTAQKIYDVFDGDVFAEAMKENSRKILDRAGIKPEVAGRLISVVREFREMDEILSLIRTYGGTYMDAYLIHQAYGMNSVETVSRHPYAAAALGTAYDVCERIAKANTIPYFDHERICALLQEAFRIAEQDGHTAMTLTQLIEAAGNIEKHAGCGYHTPVFFLCGHLMNGGFAFYENNGATYVQTEYRNSQEHLIAARIRSLQDRNIYKPTDETLVSEIEKDLGVIYSPEQRAAFRLLEYPGVKILTGGPGTGKTTLLHGLIRYYREIYGASIRLCSPTAAAAQRMREATDYPAETVHRALGLLSGGQKARQNRKGLDKGLVIVDEVSMLDEEIFSMLLEQTAPGTTLLLVGDEEQLESVGPGNILADLLSDSTIPAIRLKTVYRQESDSSILSNSIKIRFGKNDLIFDEDSRVFTVQSEKELSETALRLMELLYDKDEPFRTRLLSPVRSAKYAYGVEPLNRTLQERLNSRDGVTLACGENVFRTGDPVQMTKNNYKAGYINGDIGIIRSIDTDHGGKLIIDLEGKEESLEVTGSDLSDVSLAYAQTVHKAQGGECDTCIILLPEKPKAMLYRKILYVAATRAKKKNIFIVQNNAGETAIANAGHVKRVTGLNYQLEQTR